MLFTNSSFLSFAFKDKIGGGATATAPSYPSFTDRQRGGNGNGNGNGNGKRQVGSVGSLGWSARRVAAGQVGWSARIGRQVGKQAKGSDRKWVAGGNCMLQARVAGGLRTTGSDREVDWSMER